MTTWQYGTAWEEYPIQYEGLWEIDQHRFLCGDLTTWGALSWVRDQQADFMYVDPPWTQAVLSGFYTKAGQRGKAPVFRRFLESVVAAAQSVAHDSWIEMGNTNADYLKRLITDSGGVVVADWNVKYYRIHASRLIQAAWGESKVPRLALDGMWDRLIPRKVCEALPPASRVMDVCAGRGLTAVAAVENGHAFSGLEIHPRRLAHSIKKVKAYEPR